MKGDRREWGQRVGDAERKKKKRKREESKVGQTEHEDCRLGLTPVLPLLHLSLFLFARFMSSCLSVFYFLLADQSAAIQYLSSCSLVGTVKWQLIHHMHLLMFLSNKQMICLETFTQIHCKPYSLLNHISYVIISLNMQCTDHIKQR